MKDFDRLFSQILGAGFGRGFGDRSSGGLAGGLLSSLLLGGRRRRFGGVARYGALAAIGALAYKAWNELKEGSGGRRVVENETIVVPSPIRPDEELRLEAPPEDSGFVPRDEEDAQQLGLLLVRAMISAAHSDGRLDGEETDRILDQIEALDLDPEDKAQLLDELRHPAKIDDIARAVRTPEQAAEVYAATVLAVDSDSAMERSHLRRMAEALELGDELVRRIEENARALG